MDQFVIDVSAIPDVQQDDEVVLIGRQGDDTITAQEVADLAGTIQNEIITALSARVVRVYLRAGSALENSESCQSGASNNDRLFQVLCTGT